MLLYKELQESQTATITFSSMLQFTPDCTALSWPVELSAVQIGCYVTHVTQWPRC